MLQGDMSSTIYANTGIKNNDDSETLVLQLLTSGYKILAGSFIFLIRVQKGNRLFLGD